jgi:PLP dependent protein
MSIIKSNIRGVRSKINEACLKINALPHSVCLIAISKTYSPECILESSGNGINNFGENKLQEAEGKILSLPASLRWHFVGRIQRNKVRKILLLFPIIHSVESLAIATYINKIASELNLKPQIFIQVNIGYESTKAGFDPSELENQFNSLLTLSHLNICGLMCIPPIGKGPEDSRKWFVNLRLLRDKLESIHQVKLKYMSMGMSDDYEVAIEEGATHVRIGSAIFGKR